MYKTVVLNRSKLPEMPQQIFECFTFGYKIGTVIYWFSNTGTNPETTPKSNLNPCYLYYAYCKKKACQCTTLNLL